MINTRSKASLLALDAGTDEGEEEEEEEEELSSSASWNTDSYM